MVITRRQKSSAMPVVVEEPKSQARKDIGKSNIVDGFYFFA